MVIVCLPVEVFVYGNDKNSKEVRVKIISEMALNIDYYLEKDNLKKGLTCDSREASLKKVFVMFSGNFIQGIALTDDITRLILENEIKSISIPKSFMSIWQMFGLAPVLQMPIFSVYPMLGENFYRQHLHHLIVPRITSVNYTAAIMWTSIREDMIPLHWEPNHFVPVLSNEHIVETIECNNVPVCNTGSDETLQTENNISIIQIEVITGPDEETVKCMRTVILTRGPVVL